MRLANMNPVERWKITFSVTDLELERAQAPRPPYDITGWTLAYPLLSKLAAEIGVTFEGITTKPTQALKLRPVKVGLWDQYGGSMDSGQIRWLFEKAFPTQYGLVFPPQLDAGNLKAKYDILIFPGGAIPDRDGRIDLANFLMNMGNFISAPGSITEEWKDKVGLMSVTKTLPQIRRFLEDGGTVLSIGSSTILGYQLKLPMADALAEPQRDGSDEAPGPRQVLYPGIAGPGGGGQQPADRLRRDEAGGHVLLQQPVIQTAAGGRRAGSESYCLVLRPTPLHSGWAWGEITYGAAAALEAPVGKGRLYLFGPEINFRSQPHATMKFIFNAIDLAGGASPVALN